MATAASMSLFLFLLSILTVCSSGFSVARLFEQEELKREHYGETQHDLNTVYPTTPVTNPVTTPVTNPVTTPATFPPVNPTPTIVTVPSTTPASTSPNPASTTPLPYTNPGYPTVPVTNPVTTPATNPVTPPVTNPATNFPPPSGNVPVTTPVTTPPAVTNAPAIPGQSWCVAKAGTPETALQAALDYACGIGGADCSTIQQGGSCYNPNTLQNHASYAFNSYYQKSPSQSSCDFGGTALISNANPSSGSCVYPSSSSPSSSSSSSSSSPNIASPTSTPTTTGSMPASPTPIPTSSAGAAIPGYGTPPAMFNASDPGTGIPFDESPRSANSSTSTSSTSQPIAGSSFILVASVITATIILDM